MLNAFAYVVAAIATLRVLGGLLGIAISLVSDLPLGKGLPAGVSALQIVVFTAAALTLIRNGRDERSLYSGTSLLLVASAFARRPFGLLVELSDAWLPLVVLSRTYVDALLPAFFWLFCQMFPRALPTRGTRFFGRLGAIVSLVLGIVLVGAGWVSIAGGETAAALAPLSPSHLRGWYWLLVYGAMLPAIPLAAWRMRLASEDERRRCGLLAGGVASATVPLLLFVVAYVVVEPFASWFSEFGSVAILPLVEILILSIPIVTAYAILVDRALPVRVAFRAAIRYAFSRALVAIAAALPFLWLAWYLYGVRDRSVNDLLGGWHGVGLAFVLAVGLSAMRARERAREAVDRAFFREQYDAQQILLSLAGSVGGAKRIEDLARLLVDEIDRALHLESISVLVSNVGKGNLVSVVGDVRPLDERGRLAALFTSGERTIDIDFAQPSAEIAGLPDEDRHWLVDTAARLAVPLVSADGALVGLILLGPKRSELPFSKVDRELLRAIGSSGSVALDARLGSGSVPPRVPEPEDETAEDAAVACVACATVSAHDVPRCPACGGAVSPVTVPPLLQGKFRLKRRLGQGGMGVVFLAEDLALERDVAIKTLPARSPEDAASLRREARATAAVLHPNLVVIHAVETWKGTPLLVSEYLEGGTLGDQIEGAALGSGEAESLGLDLGGALGAIHAAGMLHRDVKPTNIGFTRDGTPKLLDFGLARVARADRSSPSDEGDVEAVGNPAVTEAGAIIGTPLYMSPDALRGAVAEPSFDVWALCVVLFEAITGRHPFDRGSWADTYRAIRSGDVAEMGDDTPEPLRAFFARALGADRRQRPADAAEFVERWATAHALARIERAA